MQNSTVYLTWSPNYKEMFWDLDGTLAGEPNSMILKFYQYNDWTGDTTHLPDSVNSVISCVVIYCLICVCDYLNQIYQGAMLVHNHTRARRVEIDNITPSQLPYTGICLHILNIILFVIVYDHHVCHDIF